MTAEEVRRAGGGAQSCTLSLAHDATLAEGEVLIEQRVVGRQEIAREKEPDAPTRHSLTLLRALRLWWADGATRAGGAPYALDG